jgi:hypothetical protein
VPLLDAGLDLAPVPHRFRNSRPNASPTAAPACQGPFDITSYRTQFGGFSEYSVMIAKRLGKDATPGRRSWLEAESSAKACSRRLQPAARAVIHVKRF